MPMLSVPDDILTRFEAMLDKRGIDRKRYSEFKKWLRYFLDFCASKRSGIRCQLKPKKTRAGDG